MRVIENGVRFIAEGSNGFSQELVFCHKDKSKGFINGLTNETIIDILISRYVHFVGINDSEENIQCLTFLRQIKSLIAARTSEKIKRNLQNDNSGNRISIQAAGGERGHKEIPNVESSENNNCAELWNVKSRENEVRTE